MSAEQIELIIPAVIGVIGTLLGTVLGWVLSSLSKRGKLKVFPSWRDEFQHEDGVGGFAISKRREEAKLYSYHFSLDLYNSSGEPRIMRRIEVAFSENRKELFRDTPKDDSTGHSSGPVRFYDDILPITIPAKTVITVRLHGGFWNSEEYFSKIWSTKKVFLKYRDARDREKRVLIKKDDFSRYFENHHVDE